MPFDIKQNRTQWHFQPATQAELHALGDRPEGFVAGWATASSLNAYGQVVAPGAFDDAIARRGLSGPRSIKFLVDHHRVAGAITKLEQRGDKLWIEAQYELGISYAKDSYLAAKAAGGLNFSVGFYIETYEWNEKTEILTITKGDLFEVSVVPFPANEDATMEVIHEAAATPSTIAEFEKLLVKLGLAPSRNAASRITREVKRHSSLFQPALDAPVAPAAEPAPPLLAGDVLHGIGEHLARMRKALTAGS